MLSKYFTGIKAIPVALFSSIIMQQKLFYQLQLIYQV